VPLGGTTFALAHGSHLLSSQSPHPLARSHPLAHSQDVKPYVDQHTFVATAVHRLQSGLHDTTDMLAAFDLLDRKKSGRIDANDLCDMFSSYTEPLELDEAKVS
jgi:Ca2+-binding EF-hand superfamily protein